MSQGMQNILTDSHGMPYSNSIALLFRWSNLFSAHALCISYTYMDRVLFVQKLVLCTERA